VFAALNRYERATSDGFLLSNVFGRARCRSLSPLNAASRTPSQVSSNVTPGVRTLALARGADGFSRSDAFIPIHAATTFNGFGARVPGMKLAAARLGGGKLVC
jgi:hypothetical protein